MSQQAKLVLVIVAVIAVIYGLFAFDVVYRDKVDDFATCVAAGNPVMESHPRQCRDRDGNLYVETVPAAGSDMIRVSEPVSGAVITSPLRVTGEARGGWYFEAVFDVEVLDANERSLGKNYVTAEGEWMTEEFSRFSGEVRFSKPATRTGIVRFHRHNASDMRELDSYFDVPVSFVSGTTTAKACVISGCSAQICGEQEMASTCEFRAEYACYKSAKCERQANGTCGWTQTPALLACLKNPAQL